MEIISVVLIVIAALMALGLCIPLLGLLGFGLLLIFSKNRTDKKASAIPLLLALLPAAGIGILLFAINLLLQYV